MGKSEKSMKQLVDMPGICKYCTGCLRLEDENFKSRYRCKDFETNQLNWQESAKFVSAILEEILKYKICIFRFIQQYYRWFMKDKDICDFPEVRLIENDNY